MATRKAIIYPELRDTFSHCDLSFLIAIRDSLINELTSQLIEQQARESIRVARVTNTNIVPNPQLGDIRFNEATSKFQGYTGSAWVDFH